LVNSFGPIPTAQAQEFRLPAPGVMVRLSLPFNPPILKGLKVHPDNPFRFEFILDKGSSAAPLKAEATKLIKYFLASLTIPEKDLWVNLSPYEKNRIIPQSFGLTEMGRDLLAEDYMLKQITASLIYPERETGKKFWKRVYEEAAKKFGTTNIPVNTFNKVWIVPEKAVVYENAKAGTAYIVESKLKVMLEQDYLSLSKHANVGVAEGRASRGQDPNISMLGCQIVREIIIPELTKEVNEGKNFAQLRQVYNSLILATWYKKKIKESILAEVYENKNKTAGVQYASTVIPGQAGIHYKNDVETIYRRYLQAFKKGVYNYIKEEFDPITQQVISRKYFSGGMNINPDHAMAVTGVMPKLEDFAQTGMDEVTVDLGVEGIHQDGALDFIRLDGGGDVSTRLDPRIFDQYKSMPFQVRNDEMGRLSISAIEHWDFINSDFNDLEKNIPLIQHIEMLLKEREKIVLVEWGCGQGAALIGLHEKLKELYGDDASRVALYGYANEYYPAWQKAPQGVHFILDTAERLKDHLLLQAGHVQLIFSNHGLETTLPYLGTVRRDLYGYSHDPQDEWVEDHLKDLGRLLDPQVGQIWIATGPSLKWWQAYYPVELRGFLTPPQAIAGSKSGVYFEPVRVLSDGSRTGEIRRVSNAAMAAPFIVKTQPLTAVGDILDQEVGINNAMIFTDKVMQRKNDAVMMEMNDADLLEALQELLVLVEQAEEPNRGNGYLLTVWMGEKLYRVWKKYPNAFYHSKMHEPKPGKYMFLTFPLKKAEIIQNLKRLINEKEARERDIGRPIYGQHATQGWIAGYHDKAMNVDQETEGYGITNAAMVGKNGSKDFAMTPGGQAKLGRGGRRHVRKTAEEKEARRQSLIERLEIVRNWARKYIEANGRNLKVSKEIVNDLVKQSGLSIGRVVQILSREFGLGFDTAIVPENTKIRALRSELFGLEQSGEDFLETPTALAQKYKLTLSPVLNAMKEYVINRSATYRNPGLLKLVEIAKRRNGQGVLYNKRQLAYFLEATPEAVSRILTRLEKQGMGIQTGVAVNGEDPIAIRDFIDYLIKRDNFDLPSKGALARQFHLNIKTIDRVLKELEEDDLIKNVRFLGMILKLARISKGWSIAHLAQELNITSQSVRNFESNIRIPSSPFVFDLLKKLEISTTEVKFFLKESRNYSIGLDQKLLDSNDSDHSERVYLTINTRGHFIRASSIFNALLEWNRREEILGRTRVYAALVSPIKRGYIKVYVNGELIPREFIDNWHVEEGDIITIGETANAGPNAAMNTLDKNTGGIDLRSDKALFVQNNGRGIKFYIDPAMLAQLQNAPGFTPVIINIQPMTDLRRFLGLPEAVQEHP